MDYKNLQVFSLQGFSLISDNAKATSQGLDVEFIAMPTSRIQLAGSWSYLDATYDEYISGSDDFSGNTLPNAPKRSRNIKASYIQPLAQGGDIEFSADYSYKSTFYFDADSSPLRTEDPVELFNANVTWTSAQANWQVSAWGQNLADEEYRAHSVISGFAGTADLYAAPRTYGVTVDYTF